MLTQHIALVPEEAGFDPSELARVSAALQKQVARDLMPLWSITATVDAFPHLEDVPIGYWPVILTRCELGNHGRVHLDRSGQPYAQVQLRPHWSLAASRACLEMLVNPFESRSVSALSLRADQGPVDFLVEVCGPCEDARFAYVIDGIAVADFCTPAFFGARAGQPERCTFRGMALPALRPQPGGHMTWHDPISNSYWLRHHWGDNPIDTKLGSVDRKIVSVRELVHACAPRTLIEPVLHDAWERNGPHAVASQRRAQQLRGLLGTRLDLELDAAFDAVRTDSAAASCAAAARGAPTGRAGRAGAGRTGHKAAQRGGRRPARGVRRHRHLGLRGATARRRTAATARTQSRRRGRSARARARAGTAESDRREPGRARGEVRAPAGAARGGTVCRRGAVAGLDRARDQRGFAHRVRQRAALARGRTRDHARAAVPAGGSAGGPGRTGRAGRQHACSECQAQGQARDRERTQAGCSPVPRRARAERQDQARVQSAAAAAHRAQAQR